MRNTRSFVLGCAIELGLIGVAAVLGWWLDRPLLDGFDWSATDLALGALASLPMLALMAWLLEWRLPQLARIRRMFEDVLRPFFANWTLGQLGVISLIAGVSEELLFRGMIQGALSPQVGPVPALVLASVLFGCGHCLTWAYAVLAGLIGAWLGALWLCTGNLLVPMTAHALYDFLALVYFLKFMRPVSLML